jgi:hypothetical protein
MDFFAPFIGFGLPLIYLIICISLVIGAFRAFGHLRQLVDLQTQANKLAGEMLAELRATK